MLDQVLLSNALLRTLAYYDVHSFPLTVGDAWRWLHRGNGETWNVTEAQVSLGLQQLVADKKVEQHDDYFTLLGRGEIVATRRERAQYSKKKLVRARAAAKFLEVVPFVKLVAVANTLAINNAREESDIDFVIVTSTDRIWITRLMVTGIINLLGYRRHGTNIKDRICLSFYLTDSNLNLQPLVATPGEDDPHFRFWATQIVPLMDDGAYKKYQSENTWVTERLPNAWPTDWQQKVLPPNKTLRAIKHAYEQISRRGFGLLAEQWSKAYQVKRIASHVNSKAKLKTTDVVISDDVLKFHEADRRRRYNLAYRLRLHQLGIPE